MVNRALRILVWLVVPALFATFVIGSTAAGSAVRDEQPAFRIVTSGVSDVMTQDVTPEIARSLHMSRPEGVVITDVMNSPLRRGDVILSVNGSAVGCQKDLDALLAQARFGQTLLMEVYRDGRIQSITVQLAMETPACPMVLPDTSEIRGIRVASLSTQDGVIVSEVQIGTPASDLGLKSGDIILEVDGHVVHTADEFLEFMRQLSGRSAAFNVLHTNGGIDVFVVTA